MSSRYIHNLHLIRGQSVQPIYDSIYLPIQNVNPLLQELLIRIGYCSVQLFLYTKIAHPAHGAAHTVYCLM